MLGSGARLVPGFVMKGDSIAGRYRIDRVLGSGSGGFVVAARHMHTREKVALKVLTNGAAPPAQPLPESPHIARVIDTGYTHEGQAFIATEMLDGQSLAQLLATSGPLTARFAVSLVQQACAGLTHAHAAGIAHGDLKPQNLILTSDGVLKIVDFGMTMVVEDEHASAAWFASPAYLAPEQLRDTTFDARADVWALAVILHELIAGKLPFESETIAGMFVAVAYDDPRALAGADVPDELARVVQSCLAKNASERPSVSELAERLAPFSPAESLAPQLAMTIEEPEPESAPPSFADAAEAPLSEEPIDSLQVVEPSPMSRMKAAFESSTSRPPPLPGSRLGATPRARVTRELGRRFGRGWLSARLMAQTLAPAVHTSDRELQRRRWGAVGVVAVAASLGVASLFVAPSSSSGAAAASDLAEEPAEVAEIPLTFGLGAFVPPTFTVPEREDAETHADRAATPPAALPVRWPLRARLLVRDDPYSPYAKGGFTHPRTLAPKPLDPRQRQASAR